jgi:hypothetical protein
MSYERSVRLVDNLRVDITQQGNKRKYARLFVLENNNYINLCDSKKYPLGDDDSFLIDEVIKFYINQNKFTGEKSELSYYKITEDPFTNDIKRERYGTSKYPYYLNNSCNITIEWYGMIPNPNFELGTFSNIEEAVEYNKDMGISRWEYGMSIISNVDKNYGGDNIVSDWELNGYRDKSSITDKNIVINTPDKKRIMYTKDKNFGYSNMDSRHFANLSD